jgi:hypothetical protein
MQLQLKTSTTAPVRPAKLTAFVNADLRFDISAIKADAKARYGSKLDFINRYTGSARRRWQRLQARRAVEGAWREAKSQLHNLVFDRMPRELPYTPAEAARMQQLRAAMGCAPVSGLGNADFQTAAGECARINWNAQQRAYHAIIATARGEA